MQQPQRSAHAAAADGARAARLLPTDLAGALYSLLVHIAICLRLDGSTRDGSSGGNGASWPAALRPTAAVRYTLWCMFVRPARLGDWAWLLTTLDYLAVTALMLVLVGVRHSRSSSRGAAAAATASGAATAAVDRSALWRWWSRYRDLVIMLHTPFPRTLLHCAAYATLPRHHWAQSGFAQYTRAVVTRPVVDAVFVLFYHTFVPMSFPGSAILLPALNIGTAFVLSWVVGPHLLQQSSNDGAASHNGGGMPHPAPQQRLLTELPLRQQVLIAVLYILGPLGLWHLRKRGRPNAGARLSPVGSSGQQNLPAKKVPTLHHATKQQTLSLAIQADDTTSVSCAGSASSAACRAPDLLAVASRPVSRRAGQRVPLQPILLAGRPTAAAGTAPPQHQQQLFKCKTGAGLVLGYRGLTSCAVLSVKVQNHPGTFESYSRRVLEAAPAITAAAAAVLQPPGSLQPLHSKTGNQGAATCVRQAVVVRGCVQLIIWTRTLAVGLEPAAAAGAAAAESAVQQPHQQAQIDNQLLCQLLPDGDQVSGSVAVQTHQQPLASGDRPGVQLLHLAPPVLPLTSAAPAADAQPPTPHEPLRLRLFSPQPQRARLIVVSSSSSAAPATAATAVGLHTQQVLAELQVQLCAGEQELELGGGLLQQLLLQAAAGSCASGAAAGDTAVSRARALQLLLLPPVHDDNEQADEAEVVDPGAQAPLLHFAAPLLVLPADAAAELCGLWGQVAAEAAGDAAAAHAHLQPLLSDLCYVLEVAQAEAEEAAQARSGDATAAMVSADLLSYLRSAGLPATAALVAGAGRTAPHKPATAASLAPCPAASSACCTADPGSATSSSDRGSHAPDAVSSSGDEGSGSKQTGTLRRRATAATTPGTARPAPPSSAPLPTSAPTVAAAALPAQPSLTDLVFGFSVPGLESQFQAWRALRLAGAAPYLMLVTALPYVMASTRSVLQGYPHMASMNLLNGLEWAADILALIGLVLLVGRRQRLLQQRRARAAVAEVLVTTCSSEPAAHAAANSGSGSSSGSITGTSTRNTSAAQPASSSEWADTATVCGTPSRSASAAAVPAATGLAGAAAADASGLAAAYNAYEATQTFIAPLVLFVTLLLTRLGVLTFNPAYVGSSGLAAALVTYRGVYGPLAYPLRARCAASPAVLLLYGMCDAMQLTLAKPHWGGARVLALVVLVRAAAAFTSAAAEWRTRSRFLQQWRRRQQQGDQRVLVSKPAGKSSVGTTSAAASTSGQQPRTPPRAVPSTDNSYRAYAAARLFQGDLRGSLVALLLQVIYAGVAIGRGGAGNCASHLALGAALPGFPCGAGFLGQTLHVLRHAAFYELIRPARLRDWPSLAANVVTVAVALLMAVLGVLPRRGPLWHWWCRWREVVLACHMPLVHSVMHAASYALRTRALWPLSGFTPYTAAMTARPMVDALFLSCYGSMMPVRPQLTAALAVLHVALAFVVSHFVGPVVAAAVVAGAAGHGVATARPPRLLSKLPLPQQVMVATFGVAWPVWLSLLTERRMRRRFATATAAAQRPPGTGTGNGSGRSSLEEAPAERTAAAEPQWCDGSSCNPASAFAAAMHKEAPPGPRPPEVAAGQASAPAAAQQPPAAPRRRLRGLVLQAVASDNRNASPVQQHTIAPIYRGQTTVKLLSFKVRQHPGSFESYSCRLLGAAKTIAAAMESEQLLQADHCGASAGVSAAAEPLPPLPKHLTQQAVVVRGCAQLIIWTRCLVTSDVANVGVSIVASAATVADPQELLITGLLSRLPQLLPGGDQVSGSVAVQQQEAVAAAPAAGGAGSPGVQLLHLSPPVLPLTSAALGADAQPPPPREPLRLRLFSPQPQRARLIVAGSSRNGSHGDAGPATAATAVGLHTQQVLAELQLLLQAAGSCASGAAAGETAVSRARALQLLLLPPVHDDNEQADEATEAEAEPGAPAPLLHFAAPLLVLPADAAAELCGLWGQVAAEAAGDAAAAHAHLQPLLSDLCYVLEVAQAKAEAEEAAQARSGDAAAAMVSADLMSYLRSAGLPATAALVAGAGSTAPHKPATAASLAPCPAASSACCSADPGSATSSSDRGSRAGDAVSNSGDEGSGSKQTGTLRRRATAATTPGTASPAPPSSAPLPTSAPTVAAAALPAQPSTSQAQVGSDCELWTVLFRSLRPSWRTAPGPGSSAAGHGHRPPCPSRQAAAALLHGFSPRQLETQFEAWRALRLARAAPFLMAMTAQPYLLTAIRNMKERYARAAAMNTLLALEWAADNLALVALLLYQRVAGMRWLLANAFGGRVSGAAGAAAARTGSRQLASAGTSSGRLTSCSSTATDCSAAAAADVGRGAEPVAAASYAVYEQAAAIAAPALYISALAAAHAGLLAFSDSYHGDTGVTLVTLVFHGMLFPLLCPSRLRSQAASPLTWLLHTAVCSQVLRMLHPSWSCSSVAALALAVRLCALAVIATSEWRARRQFLLRGTLHCVEKQR
ncbi:hypothetical protein HYH02_006147 [Chlamydomonas schloesseri]|uniref:Uncharacterized protein n=1 Tax=Chlamydomonas schloesseri TaxID=2026947 RepID=A0A835WJY0_9CHLO|nr:hypothetical protein HYH02_006147 [Chlamydomonas schloesseri]|eukprot:KAG2448796.1 hypothetical protein HYH02_006147 [Chlamydomonas schloesseri]